MRRDGNPRMLPERVIVREWFEREHIENGVRELAAVKGPLQVQLDLASAATGVNYACAPRQPVKEFRREQSARRPGERE